MPSIIFYSQDSTRLDVETSTGSPLMESARARGLPGIDADCGGCCACATCHVYIDEAWRDRVTPISDGERELLTIVSAPQAGSRLSCQIRVTDELDGLIVRLPESQM
jgi:2Fe-2S ferredoxin